jgi:signal transduction histidine kinase
MRVNGESSDSTRRSRRRLRLLGAVVATTLLLVQLLPPLLFVQDARLSEMPFPIVLVMLEAATLLTLLAGVTRFVDRRGASPRRWVLFSVPAALLAGACVGSLAAYSASSGGLLSTIVDQSFGPTITPFRGAVVGLVIGVMQLGVWSVAFVIPTELAAEHARRRELDGLRREAEGLRAIAELQRLRSQLEPHFLLNTLNMVSGLVTIDPEKARWLVSCLGDLLRDALREQDELQPLESELEWLARYVEILELRHLGQFTVEWDVDRAARTAMVPRLLLQPLVENAVQHGALRCVRGGRVRIVARKEHRAGEPRLICSVEDNGPGVTPSVRDGAIGVGNVRRRLELSYTSALFTLASEDGITRADIDVPFLEKFEGARSAGGESSPPNKEAA